MHIATQGQIGNLIDIRDMFQRLLSILSLSKEIHDINTVYSCTESRAERTIQLLHYIQNDDATSAIYYYKFLYDLHNGNAHTHTHMHACICTRTHAHTHVITLIIIVVLTMCIYVQVKVQRVVYVKCVCRRSSTHVCTKKPQHLSSQITVCFVVNIMCRV